MLWLRDAGAGELCDVAADPTEHVELGAAQPTLLAELQSLLAKRNLGNFDPDRGAESIAVLRGLRNGGYYGPFVDVSDYYSPVPPPTPAEGRAREVQRDDPAPEPTGGEGSDRRRRPRGGHRRGRRLLKKIDQCL